MILLTEYELTKLAEELELPHHLVQKVFSMGLLKERLALKYIVRHDYRSLMATKKYTREQIRLALANKYKMSTKHIKSCLSVVHQHGYHCLECGRKINRAEYKRNDGSCDHCIALTINV